MTKLSERDKEIILAMPEDDYMNSQQRNFFRTLLQEERLSVQKYIEEMKSQLQDQQEKGDAADIALREEQLGLLLRQIDRQSRLLPKYDASLLRIENGEYGFCLETGDPIGLERLLLRPTAELSIEAKTKAEKVEVQYRKY